MLIMWLAGASDIYPHFGCWPCWPIAIEALTSQYSAKTAMFPGDGSRGIPISGQRKGLARSGVPAVDSERIFRLCGAAFTACDLGLCLRVGQRSGVSLRQPRRLI